MLAIHMTKTRSVDSIMEKGILRNQPLLDKFNGIMKEDYGTLYNKEKGLVFSYICGVNDQRYFTDQIYWNMWGKPRNIMLKEVDYYEYHRMDEIGPKVFEKITYTGQSYTALLIDIPHNPHYDSYYHCQDHGMNHMWNDMEERYEHNDMPLVLINYDVHPSHIKGIVGTANTAITKTNKIDVYTTMKYRRV